MLRARLHRDSRPEDGSRGEGETVGIDAAELSGLFAAPSWLRDAGMTAWLLVGVAVVLSGAVVLLSLVNTIVMPLIAAGVIAAVVAPLLHRLSARGVPRAAGAAIVLLGIAAVAVGVVFVIVAGITSQIPTSGDHLDDAKTAIRGWLEDIGVKAPTAQDAMSHASATITKAASALLEGIGAGIAALSSLAFFLAFTALSLVFLLKDGPLIRSWVERHVGLPVGVAHTATERVLQSLRGYFVGVTIVAAFNAVVVGVGAIALGVPAPGTIAAVTFLGAYIPYLGAWGAGAFAVLIALGGAGTGAAAAMIVIQLLANGALQQLVQPFAMGAALGIHPLVVFVVTIAGGSLFGAVGLVLAAPLTAAAVRIAADVSRARAEAEARARTSVAATPDEPAPAL